MQGRIGLGVALKQDTQNVALATASVDSNQNSMHAVLSASLPSLLRKEQRLCAKIQ